MNSLINRALSTRAFVQRSLVKSVCYANVTRTKNVTRYRFNSVERSYSSYQYKNFQNTPNSNAMTLNKFLAVLGAGVGIFVITHIEETPISHRKRFIVQSADFTEEMAEQNFKAMLAQYGRYILPKSHPLYAYVNPVVKKLIVSSQKLLNVENDLSSGDLNFGKKNLAGVNWEVFIVDNPRMSPNAFVMPGGKIFIINSILPICANEDGLATVLSHEIAHQVAKHISESSSLATLLHSMSFFLFTSDSFSRIASFLVSQNFSRKQESEADHIGLMIMANACFNVNEAKAFWERFARQTANQESYMKPFFWALSHPLTDQRAKAITNWIPEVTEIYERAGCNDFHDFSRVFRGF